jgi:phosphoglycerol transferase
MSMDPGSGAAAPTVAGGRTSGDIDLTGDGEPVVVGHEDERRSERPVEEAPGPGVYGFPRHIQPVREGLGVCAVVGALLVLVYKLWQLSPNVPMSYDGDGMFGDMMTKGIRENGWLLHNPRIGAPFGGSLYDFPQGGENIHFATLKVFGFVLPSWGATINAYFLATFFLVALSTYFVARYLKLGRGASLIVAVLYTFLPYHEAHGAAQVWRSGYYIVPLAALVILWVVDYRRRFFESGRLALRRRRWRFVFAVAVCLVLGGSDTQNSLFAVCLIGTVVVLLAIANRDARPLAIGAVLSMVILGSLALNNAPSVLYRYEHGTNTEAAHRTLLDVDAFSLSFARLLLPTYQHRIEGLANLEQTARTGGVVQGEFGEALGVVGAAGLVIALLVGFGRLLRDPPTAGDEDVDRGDREPRRKRRTWSRLEPLVTRFGGLSILAILFGMTGGISYLIGLAGFVQLRTWNRIVLYIGLFALLTVGVLLDALFRRVRRRARTAGAGLAVVAALVVVAVGVGVWDQTSPALVPKYETIAQKYKYDDFFFKTLEQRLPGGAMIFQYPIIPFPESPPVGKMQDYEHFIGYLHTTHLRWSYGAMRGRPEGDWQVALQALPTRTQLAGLAAAGFQGVYIDRDGYTATGPAFERQVQAALGAPTLTSTDQRLVYYDLGRMRRALAAQLTASQRSDLGQAIVDPVRVEWGRGFYQEESGGGNRWHWGVADARLTIHNPAQRMLRVALSATLGGRGGSVTILGLGAAKVVKVASAGTAWSATFDLPPGKTTVRFLSHMPATVSPDPRVLYLDVTNLSVLAPALQDALCRFEPAGATRPPSCP